MRRVTATLKAHGLPWQDFEGTPGRVQTRPDGVQQLFFQDADGYWVEVNDAPKVGEEVSPAHKLEPGRRSFAPKPLRAIAAHH
jgi:hypothetical protein